VRRALAGGAGKGDEAGCSGGDADERGGEQQTQAEKLTLMVEASGGVGQLNGPIVMFDGRRKFGDVGRHSWCTKRQKKLLSAV
jgi:hypothetical protein